MKLYITTSLLLLSIFGLASAQSIRPVDTLNLKKTSWNVNMGSTVGTSQRGTVLFNSFVAPQFTYTQNSKWSFGGGAMISNTQIKSPIYLSGEQTAQKSALNFSQSTLYAFGTYQPTDRLTLNALVYKSFDLNDNTKNQTQLNSFNTNMKGVMVNMSYKITEHSSINIGLNYSDGGYNPIMQSSGMGNFGMGQHSFMGGW